MDAIENPSVKFDRFEDPSTKLSQSNTSYARIENVEISSTGVNILENPSVNADKLRDPFEEASQYGNLFTETEIASTEMDTRDNGLPGMAAMDGLHVKTHENTSTSFSLLSAIAHRALAVFQMPSMCSIDCRPRGNIRVRWNAALRRAVAIDPMRRLHERLLGCRWAPSPSSCTHLIWLLGVCYPLSESDDLAANMEIYKQFEADLRSRIWITYRKGFQAIVGTKLTTDVGWGCMIRSGQMLLAQALICHHLGRSWRRSPCESNLRGYLEILQCFGDISSCSYSIHNIVASGAPYGLVAGSWLGPYAMCRSLEALVCSNREHCKVVKFASTFPMAIHVVSGDADGERGGAPCICIDVISKLCTNLGETTEQGCALLLLIPLVLGLNKVNPRYFPLLSETFTFPQSLGILGGKPGASTYLVGVQGDQVFYLDPHQVQQVCLVSPDNPKAETSTYHCSNVRRMPLSAIDPSLALGFYCRDQEDFKDLCERAVKLERQGNGAPMFTIVQSSKGEQSSNEDTYTKHCAHNEPVRLHADLSSSEEGWQML